MLRIARLGRFLCGGAPAATCQMVADGVDGADGGADRVPCRLRPGLGGSRRGPGRSCMALEDTFGSGRYRGGFLFGPGLAPGALGTYSTGPGLPRAGCLAIWLGAPRASPRPPRLKRKLFQISRRSKLYLILLLIIIISLRDSFLLLVLKLILDYY